MNESKHTRQATGADDNRDDLVERLLRAAELPEPVPVERLAQARVQVHQHWQSRLRRRRARNWLGGLSFAASLAFALWVGMPYMQGALNGTMLAQWQHVEGTASLDGQAVDNLSGQLANGAVVETAPASLASLQWHAGHSLRLDQSSRVQLIDEQTIVLLSGALYIDSGADQQTDSVLVRTKHGLFSDIGTQFEVRLHENSTVLRVREGIVQVSLDGDSAVFDNIEHGKQLTVSDDQTQRTAIDIHGDEWAWTFRAGGPYRFDGSTLDAFLRWLARENGWKLEYADARVRRAARQSTVHGSITGLSAVEALESILATYGYQYRLDDGTLKVGEKANQ